MRVEIRPSTSYGSRAQSAVIPSTLSTARKAIGFLILAAVAIFLFSAVVGAVIGFIKLLLSIGLVIAVAVGVVWVLRKL